MNGKRLLDTNIIVALFKDDADVRKQLAASAEIFVPAIAVGELYYGAQRSANVEKNLKQVRGFAEVPLHRPVVARDDRRYNSGNSVDDHPKPVHWSGLCAC